MILEQQVAAHFQRYNTSPLAEFCGLNPVQMHELLYQPLEAGCPVQLQPAISKETLDQVPFLRLTEDFLALVQREGAIKLTPLGALPRKQLLELYAHGHILEKGIETGFIKLNRESDSLTITTLHIVSTAAGLVKKVHGKLTITKKGEALRQPAQRPALLRQLLDTFTSRFNWAYYDAYPSPTAGQLGWAFSVYLLARFGTKNLPVSFYADKYQQAFPFLVADFAGSIYATPAAQLANCYGTRVFDRALNWFGLLTVEQDSYGLNAQSSQVEVAALLPKLFLIGQEPDKPTLKTRK